MDVALSALALWFLVALAVYAVCRGPLASALVFIGGALILPEAVAVNPPLFPDMGKQQVISLSALAGTLLFARRRLRDAKLGTGPEILIAIGAIGAVVTIFSNSQHMRFGPVVVPGTSPTDFIPDVIQYMLRWGIPFMIGRAMFTRSQDGRTLMFVLVAAGLIYSIPIMIEMQISPQLHKFVYGYMQHAFLQTKRGDGYRPMVFMTHGLSLTLFVVMTVLAACTMWRAEKKILGASFGPIAVYLAVLLIACRSTGSTLYAAALAPLALFATPRLQVRAAALLALLVISYPLLRNFDLVPYEKALEIASEYTSHRRVRSLNARLYTEQTMIERIKERPWFGWASPGRSGIRDPRTGRLSTVYDGYWIIVLSKRGAVGYLTVFGLLLWPIVMAMRAMPRIRAPGDRVVLGVLSLMIAISAFDLLPNSTVEGFYTMFSGALAGLVPGILREQRKNRPKNSGESSVLPDSEQARVSKLLNSS